MANNRTRSRRGGAIILIIILIVLILGMIGLEAKIKYDLNTPFKYHINIAGSGEGRIESMDGSVMAGDDYSYVVDISKHWENDPGTPLMTYGAQYDNTISNESGYDVVDWSIVISVPEKNITIDSYWNGEWVYDKKESTIDFTPDERIETIRAGESATFGAIMISKELMDFKNVVFSGRRYKPITQYFFFWVLLSACIVWITSAVAYVLYLIRDNNYRKNSERLNRVISQTMKFFFV